MRKPPSGFSKWQLRKVSQVCGSEAFSGLTGRGSLGKFPVTSCLKENEVKKYIYVKMKKHLFGKK